MCQIFLRIWDATLIRLPNDGSTDRTGIDVIALIKQRLPVLYFFQQRFLALFLFLKFDRIEALSLDLFVAHQSNYGRTRSPSVIIAV